MYIQYEPEPNKDVRKVFPRPLVNEWKINNTSLLFKLSEISG